MIEPIPRPDLGQQPLTISCERVIPASPAALFAAWTTDKIDRWFAAPGTVLMSPRLDRPYFFETHFDGQRHPHYGRFLMLDPDKLIEMTWQTAAGTKGVETVVTIELIPQGDGTKVRLSHAGFPDEESRKGHGEAWPVALENLDKSFSDA